MELVILEYYKHSLDLVAMGEKMTVLSSEEVLKLREQIPADITDDQKKINDLCLSHETLRLLVKNLLAQLMAGRGTEDKDLIQRAQEVVE